MYVQDQTWLVGPPKGVRGRGFGAVNCGANPCGFTDFFPLPGIFTSPACSAWLTCTTTGGGLTPTPTSAGVLQPLVPIGPPATNPAAPVSTGAGCDPGDIQCLQGACVSPSTWDPIGSTCLAPNAWPSWALPAGLVAAVVLVAFVAGGRR
jgi:hypothetical protein